MLALCCQHLCSGILQLLQLACFKLTQLAVPLLQHLQSLADLSHQTRQRCCLPYILLLLVLWSCCLFMVELLLGLLLLLLVLLLRTQPCFQLPCHHSSTLHHR